MGSCLLLSGFLMSCMGWVGIIIATATNDWVTMCKYGMNTCKKSEELKVRGPWAECDISAARYECTYVTQIMELQAYMHTTRALMITASILALPAVLLILMSFPCIKLGNDPRSAKNKRALLGGLIMLAVALCGVVSTVWFPIGAHKDQDLRAFGYSLYAGWAGSLLSLLGGLLITCCSLDCPSSSSPPSARSCQEHDRFYYSKQGGANPPAVTNTGASHAKTAHV